MKTVIANFKSFCSTWGLYYPPFPPQKKNQQNWIKSGSRISPLVDIYILTGCRPAKHGASGGDKPNVAPTVSIPAHPLNSDS